MRSPYSKFSTYINIAPPHIYVGRFACVGAFRAMRGESFRETPLQGYRYYLEIETIPNAIALSKSLHTNAIAIPTEIAFSIH